MINLLKPILKDKSILLLGFGKEGQSTFRFLRRNFPGLPVAIADRNPDLAVTTEGLTSGNSIALHLGPGYMDQIGKYDYIIKSPGVALPADLKLPPSTVLTSQTRLLLEAYHRQIIGITGTKGKSTTSSLIHHLLMVSGIPSVLVGNIGIPPFDHLESAQPGTWIVFEMSSHQLEDTILAPHIAVLLNLYPEHLDRYPSLDAYYNAKMKILSGQMENDVFIYNQDIPEISRRMKEIGGKSKFLSFSEGLKVDNGSYLQENNIVLCQNGHESVFTEIRDDTPLPGQHNRMNMMAAILAVMKAGAQPGKIKEGLASFRGLEHRLEYAGEYQHIHFYNDSIATIPEATIAAVKTLPETDTLILGGHDRMLDYTALISFLGQTRVSNFIFLGKAGARMLEGFNASGANDKRLVYAASMQEALQIALKLTAKGKICLLSPAAASYDSFKNFEERGEVFKKIARGF